MTRRALALAALVFSLTSCADGVISDSSAGADSDNDAASCVEVYEPNTLPNRSFAFDGTVSSIEVRTDPQLPAGEQEIQWVIFDVHQWFKGGETETIGVWVENLNIETSTGTMIEVEPGTRLLVSGEPRWGGAPLDDAIAWPCGFTRPWSEDLSSEWATAFRDR
jgi:hypothetical protein